MKTAVRKIGNSLGIILNKEITGSLGIHESDELEVSVARDGRTILISPLSSPHAEWEAWLKSHPKAKSEGLLLVEDEGLSADDKEWVW